MKRSVFPLVALTAALSLPAFAQPSDYVPRPAVFKVTTDIVNEEVQPYTFTGGSFGNTLNRTGKGGFEPATFRNRLRPREDAENRIIDPGIHHYDSYQSGYLDGAEVRVYRIIDGGFRLVREDRVADGGTVIEHWSYSPNKVVPAGVTSVDYKWEDWSRPESARWFTVLAVDHAGNISEPATPLKFDQQVAAKGSKIENREENFRPRGEGAADSRPPAPTNFKGAYNEQDVLEFSWDAVANEDIAGYYLAHTDTDPSAHRGVYLELEGEADTDGSQIKADDLVFVSKPLTEFSSDWFSNRIANHQREMRAYIPDGIPSRLHGQALDERTWRLVPHGPDTPVEGPGEYYFEVTLKPGETELIGKHGIPDISNTMQEFYPVPEEGAEYVMEVWMKADEPGRAPVVFTWDGDENIGGFVGRHPIEVTPEWKKYTVPFTGQNSKEGQHAYFVLKAEGPGTYAFDNFRVYRADTPYLDYLPHEYDALTKSGMSHYRTHAFIKTGTATYSMRQFLGNPGEAAGVSMGNTLPQALRMMEKANVDPWLQIEFHMSPEEWLAFMEYMAAPYDPAVDSKEEKPYAALRYSQGQAEPWVDAFDSIYFELGNETWNGLFRPWTFDAMPDGATGEEFQRGEVYAKFHDYVADLLRSSPYWKPEFEDQFVHVLGGWATSLDSKNPDRGYTQEIGKASKSGEYVTIAAYNGGWDEGEGPPKETPASYFNVMSQVNQTAIPRIVQLSEVADAAGKRLGREMKFGTYEAGPGYALNGLNNARVTPEQAESQEQVMKSKVAGVGTLDSFLARNKYGSDVDNFFTFAAGDLWKSHAKYHRGGQPHASYLPLELFNREATGDMLLVERESTPTIDTKGTRRRLSVDNSPLTEAYATRAGDRVAVFCINRQFAGYPNPEVDGVTPFTLELPFDQAESITLHRLTGRPTDHNIHSENVKVETVNIDPSQLGEGGKFQINSETGSTAENGLPPSEVYLYVFEGTNIGDPGRILSAEEVRAQPKSFPAEGG